MSQRLSRKMHLPIAGLLALLPFAVAPLDASGASDGSLGATSRGTVQIRLSIAPRIVLKRDGPIVRSGAAGDRFCFSSNNFGSYSVGVFDEAGRAIGRFPLDSGTSLPISLREAAGSCDSSGQTLAPANLSAARQGSLLFLIVPD